MTVESAGIRWRMVALPLQSKQGDQAWAGSLYYAESQEQLESFMAKAMGIHFTFGAFLLVALTACVYLILRRQVLGPLEALDFHCRIAATGRLEVWKYVPSAHNEIERLHHRFNELMSQMKGTPPPTHTDKP